MTDQTTFQTAKKPKPSKLISELIATIYLARANFDYIKTKSLTVHVTESSSLLHMKPVERRLLSELMKNSRRSDRELARVLGISQPTVTRLRGKLEKMGVIKEYTMIPDFNKLGYDLMSFTCVKMKQGLNSEEEQEFHKYFSKFEKEHPHAELISVKGMGLNKDYAFVSFFKDFSTYCEINRLSKAVPYSDINETESFLVNLKDTGLRKVLSLSSIAKDTLIQEKERT
jgi:DNA-binding Lrp family transcriptional regulator